MVHHKGNFFLSKLFQGCSFRDNIPDHPVVVLTASLFIRTVCLTEEYGMDKREEKCRLYREQYGKVIKRKRTGKNITQMELAEELGISRTTVSRYES